MRLKVHRCKGYLERQLYIANTSTIVPIEIGVCVRAQGCLIGCGLSVACKRPLARAICKGWLHIHLHPMFHKHITQTCSSIVVDSSAKRPRHTFPASDISAVEMRDWRAAATACAGDALVAAAVGRNASNNWSCGGGVARAPPQRLPALFSRVGP